MVIDKSPKSPNGSMAELHMAYLNGRFLTTLLWEFGVPVEGVKNQGVQLLQVQTDVKLQISRVAAADDLWRSLPGGDCCSRGISRQPVDQLRPAGGASRWGEGEGGAGSGFPGESITAVKWKIYPSIFERSWDSLVKNQFPVISLKWRELARTKLLWIFHHVFFEIWVLIFCPASVGSQGLTTLRVVVLESSLRSY